MVSRHPSRDSALRWGLRGSLALYVFVYAAMTATLRAQGGAGSAAMQTFDEPLPWLVLCLPTLLFWTALVSLRGRGASNVLYASLGSGALAALIGGAVASSVASPSSTDTSFAAIGDIIHVALVGLGSGWLVGLCCGAWLASSRLQPHFKMEQT